MALVRYIKENVKKLDAFEKYICKYDHENISLNNYYDSKTKTLRLPHNFNSTLSETTIPVGTERIILNENTFKSKFNCSLDNLPNSITHLILGFSINQPINKLPDSLIFLSLGWEFCSFIAELPTLVNKVVLSHNWQIELFKKKPFGCVFVDKYDNIIY